MALVISILVALPILFICWSFGKAIEGAVRKLME